MGVGERELEEEGVSEEEVDCVMGGVGVDDGE